MIYLSTLFNNGWHKIVLTYRNARQISKEGKACIILYDVKQKKEINRYNVCLKVNATPEFDFDLVFAKVFKFTVMLEREQWQNKGSDLKQEH